jgi:hypothetical protein
MAVWVVTYFAIELIGLRTPVREWITPTLNASTTAFLFVYLPERRIGRHAKVLWRQWQQKKQVGNY